jgi:Na+/H+-translocating membrane pyrophosphatase
MLDAVGNTTKATTKGFAIGSAALASFLLFSAFMDEVSAFTGKPFDSVDIAIPEVFVGGLLGSMLVFLFSAWACKAVGRSAQEVVNEVRRQFREKPGIMTYQVCKSVYITHICPRPPETRPLPLPPASCSRLPRV